MKLALVIFSLAEGGAERVMSFMANYWSHKGVEVSLITLEDANSDVYPLSQHVCRVPLGVGMNSGNPFEAMGNNLRRVGRLRTALRAIRPEIVISFMEATNVLTILATRGLGAKVVVMEHTDPESHHVEWFWNTLRRMTYRFADRVGVLTERSRPWAEGLTDPESVFVLPNAINLAPTTSDEEINIRVKVGLPDQAKVVVSMGRLAPEKGFDLLIQAFAKLAPSHVDYYLVILGEGAERSSLERARESHNLTGRVHLPGRVPNPMAYLRQCDLFVMSSRYEGFPMALCEAMACGLPVISFDCPTGPGEIIRNEVDGILVPSGDICRLTESMDHLMSNAEVRKILGAKATEVLERFSEDRIMEEWDRILAELT